MLQDLGFKNEFDSVPPLHRQHIGAGNRTYSPRAKHTALRYFFIQELIEDDTITIHCVKTQNQLADIGTKRLNRQPHRDLITKIRDFGA